MSILDLSSLSERELIFHYDLSCKQQGLNLPYSDLLVIDCWLTEINHDADALLLILADTLPQYFAKRTKHATLKNIQKSISQKIREYLMTKPFSTNPAVSEERENFSLDLDKQF